MMMCVQAFCSLPRAYFYLGLPPFPLPLSYQQEHYRTADKDEARSPRVRQLERGCMCIIMSTPLLVLFSLWLYVCVCTALPHPLPPFDPEARGLWHPHNEQRVSLRERAEVGTFFVLPCALFEAPFLCVSRLFDVPFLCVSPSLQRCNHPFVDGRGSMRESGGRCSERERKGEKGQCVWKSRSV